LIEEVEKRFPEDVEGVTEGKPRQANKVTTEVITAQGMAQWVAAWGRTNGDAIIAAAPFDGEAWRSSRSALFIARLGGGAAAEVSVSVLPLEQLATRCPNFTTNLQQIWTAQGIRWIAHDAKNVALCLEKFGA